MPTQTEPTLLDQLKEKRQTLIDSWSAAVEANETRCAEFESRSAGEDETTRPTDTEREAFKAECATFTATNDQYKAEIAELDVRIADQNEIVRRRTEAAAAHQGNTVEDVVEPLTYRRDNSRGEHGLSYLRDLAVTLVDGVNLMSTTRAQSLARLQRHAQEMEVEVPKRVEAAAKRARERVALAESRGLSTELAYDPFHRGNLYNPTEKRVEPNRTDGYGGYVTVPTLAA